MNRFRALILLLACLFGLAGASSAQQLERVDFRELPLAEACRLLADQTGLNIVPTDAASKTLVSIYLRDIDALAAIDALCKSHQLWFELDADAGFLRISTVKDYKRDLSELGPERTEFFSLLYPNAVDVGNAIENLFGDRVDLHISDTDTEIQRDLSDRLRRFDLFDTRTQGLGQGALGGAGGAAGYNSNYGYQDQGSSDITGYRTDYLDDDRRNYDEYDNQNPSRQLRDLSSEQIMELERLRTQGANPEGDATLSAAMDVTEATIHVSVALRQNKLLVRTRDTDALAQIRKIVENLDVPTSLVLLEVRVLSVELLDGMSSFFDYQLTKGNVAGQFTTGAIGMPAPPAIGVGGSGVQANDFVFQFLDKNFGARMQVLERDNRVKALAMPVLLTANNEVSRLFVGKEVPLNRSFTAGQVVANQTTTSTVAGSTDIEFRPVGTTLLITPSINADRTVTLRIIQESSNVDSTASVLVPSDTGFESQTVNIVSSQTVSGTVVAKSDMAIVFGGLIEEADVDDEEGVPLLGDIPLVGLLFKRKLKLQTRREVVIMVRPFVLTTPAEAETANRDMLDTIGIDPMRLQALERAAASQGQRLPGRNPSFSVHGIDREQ